jgi:hypothetical protein
VRRATVACAAGTGANQQMKPLIGCLQFSAVLQLLHVGAGGIGLAFDVPTLQLIAYSALTCASVIVALVSAMFGYRQNFGWKPIILPTSYGFGRLKVDEPDGLAKVTFEFEVWNRRKYPIVIQAAHVTFETLESVFTEFGTIPQEEMWDTDGTTFSGHSYSLVLDPNAHPKFPLGFACVDRPWHEIRDTVRIRVAYYDPIKNRYLTAKAKTLFQFKDYRCNGDNLVARLWDAMLSPCRRLARIVEVARRMGGNAKPLL